MTELINIGGVGSCILSEVLRKLNYPCYIFDWNCTYQSIVIDCILNLKQTYNFEKNSFLKKNTNYGNNTIKNKKNTFWDIHSFKGNYNECDNINKKYTRRLNRLKKVLQSSKNKVLIRMAHSINSLHPEINFNKEKDDKEKWIKFYKNLSKKYNNFNLIVIYNDYLKNGINEECVENITFVYSKNIFNNTNNELYKYLKNYINLNENKNK